jgi:hypothetical protein
MESTAVAVESGPGSSPDGERPGFALSRPLLLGGRIYRAVSGGETQALWSARRPTWPQGAEVGVDVDERLHGLPPGAPFADRPGHGVGKPQSRVFDRGEVVVGERSLEAAQGLG